MIYEFVIDYFTKNQIECSEITTAISEILYPLIKHADEPNIINDNNGIISFFVSSYFHVTKDYNNELKWLYISVGKSNVRAMVKLGAYFKVKKNYLLMTKYLDMAVGFGNTIAMVLMADYYQNIANDYDSMKSYLIKAIEAGDVHSMFYLGKYYKDIQDYVEMEKYYMMGVNNGCYKSMNNLGIYYDQINEREIAETYYLMAVNKGYSNAMYNLGIHYEMNQDHDNMLKYLLMASINNIEHATQRLKDFLKDRIDIYPNFVIDNWKDLPDSVKQYAIKIDIYPDDLIKTECDICMESKRIMSLKCNDNHKMCTNCFVKITSCPYCREEIK